jgi:mannosyltransferase
MAVPVVHPASSTTQNSEIASTADGSTHTATGRRTARHTIRSAAAPLSIGALALLVALLAIGTPSLWYDEVATVTSATRSWNQLGDMIGTVDAVHALYYALMHVVFDVFGYSPVSLRVPSAIATGIAAGLTVVLGRQVGGPRLGLVAGLVFCLLPRSTWMGGEGRSYAFTAAAAVLLTIVLVHAVRSPRRRWWVLYSVLVFLSCVLFIYLALIVVAHTVTMVWWLARRGAPTSTLQPVRRWVVATAAATLAVVPFALQVIGQSTQLHWLKPLGDQTFTNIVRDQWFPDSWLFAWIGWGILLVGIVITVRMRSGHRASATAAWTPSMGGILLPALTVPTLVLLTTTAVYLPIYTPRYLTMCLPFVAVLMAVAIVRLPARMTPYVAIAAIVALAIEPITAQRQPQAKEFSAWAEVADLIADERAAAGSPDDNTAIIYGSVQYHPIATARVIAYSYPEAFEGTTDVTLVTPAAETGHLWETVSPLSNSLGRLDNADTAYLITSKSRDKRASTTDILNYVGWELTDSWSFSKVNVLKFERE